MARRPLDRERIYLDGGRRTTQLMRVSLGGGTFMITPNASNWVYRGESPDPAIARLLSSYLHLDPATAGTQLQEYTTAVRGMSDADSTEVQIAGYLRSLEERHGKEHPASHRRAVAIAVWHIARCAEVRDRALKLLGIQPGVSNREHR